MAEKRTFLPYSRGIEPSMLRIGHLAIDTSNPETGREDGRFDFEEM